MATAMKLNDMSMFFAGLAVAEKRLLLLAYAGTLAPFRTSRQKAVPCEGVRELLALLMKATSTRVIFITGRPAIELRDILPIVPAPETWGSHGLEHLRMDGSYELAEIPLEVMHLLGSIDHCLEAQGLGELIEMKPGATAVHWRGLSKSLVAAIRERLLRVWNGFQPQDLLVLAEFDGGMEFRLRLRNKGDAVKQILREVSAEAAIAYLGDDHTDEDAFKAL